MAIVGVVVDQKSNNLREAVKPTFYVPYEQSLQDMQGARMPRAMFFVRANAGIDALSSSLRSTVAQLDGSLPVYRLRSMDSVVADSVYTDRLISALSTAFGVFALLLTAVGLYGVIAYLVTRRTAEIGIRMALGAKRRDIVGLVLREVVLLAIAGAAAGLAGAAVAGRAIESQLFGVRPLDPLVLTAAPAILGLVALGAAFLPALRATRIQPLQALRHE